MIKYRPERSNLSMSIKEEQTFDSMDDLLHFLYEQAQRFVAFIGSEEPVSPEHIVIGEESRDDPLLGWHNVRKVSLIRYSTPQTIGFCGE